MKLVLWSKLRYLRVDIDSAAEDHLPDHPYWIKPSEARVVCRQGERGEGGEGVADAVGVRFVIVGYFNASSYLHEEEYFFDVI